MTTALATITPTEWPMVMQQAKMLVTTGFLPKAVDTPEKAVAIMMKGRELNIPPMYALSNIVVIQGKPVANAELMLALIYRDHGDQAIEIVETTAERCTINYKRRHARDYITFTFTMDDARKAQLLSNATWQKYPAAMLRARCISAVARAAFPDTIAGLFTPEELGAVTDVETGEIEVVAKAVVQTIEQPQSQQTFAPVEVLPPGASKPVKIVPATGEIVDGPLVSLGGFNDEPWQQEARAIPDDVPFDDPAPEAPAQAQPSLADQAAARTAVRATDKQLVAIKAIGRKLGLSEAQLIDRTQQEFGRHLDNISKDQASALIGALNQEQSEAAAVS